MTPTRIFFSVTGDVWYAVSYCSSGIDRAKLGSEQWSVFQNCTILNVFLPCLWKRREVVLEQTEVQAWQDLWLTSFPPPNGCQPLPAINQVRTKVNRPPPRDMPPSMESAILPNEMCHPPPWCTTPPTHWHATPLLAAVYWWQRSTLAFWAKFWRTLSSMAGGGQGPLDQLLPLETQIQFISQGMHFDNVALVAWRRLSAGVGVLLCDNCILLSFQWNWIETPGCDWLPSIDWTTNQNGEAGQARK